MSGWLVMVSRIARAPSSSRQGGTLDFPGVIVELRGRQRELDLIASVLEDARESRARSIAFVGEPGIGKTALLGALEVAASGFRILRASGVDCRAGLRLRGAAVALAAAAGRDREPPGRGSARRSKPSSPGKGAAPSASSSASARSACSPPPRSARPCCSRSTTCSGSTSRPRTRSPSRCAGSTRTPSPPRSHPGRAALVRSAGPPISCGSCRRSTTPPRRPCWQSGRPLSTSMSVRGCSGSPTGTRSR